MLRVGFFLLFQMTVFHQLGNSAGGGELDGDQFGAQAVYPEFCNRSKAEHELKVDIND